jgi:hypothetical protein
MSKAFLDTTILTDVLLKPGSPAAAEAGAAIARFDKTLLPAYAIKEFKAGPLTNFVWFHNKLVLNSLTDALAALQRMSRSPHRYLTSTAIESLRVSVYKFSQERLSDLVAKYGPRATEGEVLRDQHRLAIKLAVMKAWKKRRRVTSEVVYPLACYKEIDPYEDRGLLVLNPTKCPPNAECSMASQLKGSPESLAKLKVATDSQEVNPERHRRSRALRNLIRRPKDPLSDQACRDLGDAVFAFLAPADATILTTNLKDHRPLADALGKRVENPISILSGAPPAVSG